MKYVENEVSSSKTITILSKMGLLKFQAHLVIFLWDKTQAQVPESPNRKDGVIVLNGPGVYLLAGPTLVQGTQGGIIDKYGIYILRKDDDGDYSVRG